MKEYNHQTRKWEIKEKNGSLKKPKLCRGNKPHNYFLVLPEYIKTLGNPTVETIEEYYKSEDRISRFIKSEHAMLKALGIVINTWSGRGYKLFRCVVCGKKEYQYRKNLS